MKKNLRSTFVIAILLMSMIACLKSSGGDSILPALAPSKNDELGGEWKPAIIGSPTEIILAEPSTGQIYEKELRGLQDIIQQRTPEQTAAVNYWASGGVLRWNQIARQLVAKYNVRPKAVEIHDYTNPIAHAPFAARTYTLLSAAQYDALITTYHYKTFYNRMSTSKSGVKGMLPDIGLPSYPSEDAAVAAASFRVLTYLFPKEMDFLYKKAIEYGNSRLWGGMNTPSDLEAGGEIGRQIGDKVIDYAKHDRFNLANDPKDSWKKLNVDVSWKSQDNPQTKPLAPLMGQVKTWNDSAKVFAAVPPPPPPVGSVEFQKAIDEVKALADKRTDAEKKNVEFWRDGVGTYNPPGHWNAYAEELIREYRFSEIRTARTLLLLNESLQDAATLCWFTKYKYYYPRPTQMNNKIKPVMPPPNFPSYTSGHSTFSGAAATFLAYIFPNEAKTLNKLADEAGYSRVLGGIHYSFDNIHGRNSGNTIGNLTIEKAKADGAN